MRRAVWKLGGAAILAGVVASVSDARAAGEAKGGGVFPAASLAKLKSDDPAVVRAALDDARLAGVGASAAIPAIGALLKSGLSYPLAEAAIDTLAELEPRDNSPFVPYALHRVPKVRVAAIRALAKTPSGPGMATAASVLQAALRDPDVLVRGTAATGLGALKAIAAVPDLFLALDRHVYEAASSIGELCNPAECAMLTARIGSVPFDVITTGLEPMLFRPDAQVREDVKVAIVTKVRDVGTREANKFLANLQRRWSKTGSAAVKRALDAGVIATSSSPGGA